MLQIRRGVYETNSSSSHSIIIKKKDHPLSRKAIDTKWVMYMNEDDPNDPDNGIIHFDRENLKGIHFIFWCPGMIACAMR